MAVRLSLQMFNLTLYSNRQFHTILLAPTNKPEIVNAV